MFAEPPTPPVAYPHPLITEVLFAVPTEKSAGGDLSRCDASKDGSRDATGDEFVELVNPHDRPIDLKGYRLRDSAAATDDGKARAGGKKPAPGVDFVFPALTLGPGEVVVVFNGHKQKWAGPVGDSLKAPVTRNDRFDNAWIFTMRAASSRAGFSNGGDFVLLSAPDGTPVERVRWGAGGGGIRRDAPLIEDAPSTSSGSVQRQGAAFVAHREIDGLPFSPGRFGTPSADTTGPSPHENPPEQPR